MLNVRWENGVRDELMNRTFALDATAVKPNSGGHEVGGALRPPGSFSISGGLHDVSY